VRALAGRTVVLRAVVTYDQGTASIDAQETITAGTRKPNCSPSKPRLQSTSLPNRSFGAISAPTDALTPDDIKWFGGKAANYGVLRRAIPANCPPAIACLVRPVGRDFSTRRCRAATRCARKSPRASPRIRPTRRRSPRSRRPWPASANSSPAPRGFHPAQRSSVTGALAGFTPGRKIRFRSSTNVEDAESFTGAGLYDSYSGCLLDDLDADGSGPERMRSAESPRNAASFARIRKVYASFYNDNAYLERLRHGVDETKVGMGVLVHHSFPDEEELANGVATLDFRYNFGSFRRTANGDPARRRIGHQPRWHRPAGGGRGVQPTTIPSI
jgi:hypothetical protein